MPPVVPVVAKPAWCQFVPVQFQEVACRGSSAAGCTCQDFCAQTSNASMQWNTECCGCAGVNRTAAAPLQLVAVQGVPAWCQYVPGAYQQTACRGSSQGCSCKDFCHKEDAGSWQWNPECCGCSHAGHR